MKMLSLMLPDDGSAFCLNGSAANGGVDSSPLVAPPNAAGSAANVARPLLTSTPLASHLSQARHNGTGKQNGALPAPNSPQNSCATIVAGDSADDDGSCGSLTEPDDQLKQLTVTSSVAAGSSIKTGKLKRVSFGSSKGSMVETLIYECDRPATLSEEEGHQLHQLQDPASDAAGVDLLNGHHHHHTSPLSSATNGNVSGGAESRLTARSAHELSMGPSCSAVTAPCKSGDFAATPQVEAPAASRLRVTYYEHQRPLFIADEVCVEDDDPAASNSTPAAHVLASVADMPTTYIVQTVDQPGWENPFRPGGELSQEADDIVRAIQAGQPLNTPPKHLLNDQHAHNPQQSADDSCDYVTQTTVAPPVDVVDSHSPLMSSPPKNGFSGLSGGSGGGTVEPQRSLVQPEDESHVQQVSIKKKRGKCCSIQ